MFLFIRTARGFARTAKPTTKADPAAESFEVIVAVCEDVDNNIADQEIGDLVLMEQATKKGIAGPILSDPFQMSSEMQSIYVGKDYEFVQRLCADFGLANFADGHMICWISFKYEGERRQSERPK